MRKAVLHWHQLENLLSFRSSIDDWEFEDQDQNGDEALLIEEPPEMDQLGKLLDRSTKRLYQEDWIDRLNYHYTVWILLAFALTLTMKEYVGEPIQCWVPAEFKEGWEEYAETFCFIENTYFLRFDEEIPEDAEERNQKEIAYYQWVPFVLALQAMMFYMPHVLWRILNWHSGLCLRGIISMACDNKCTSSESAHSAVTDIACHILSGINLHKIPPNARPMINSIFTNIQSSGYYLPAMYLLTKILFITNLICQFFILNAFLGTTYTFWGLQILQDILQDQDWRVSGHFPRVTVCDFVVRKLGNNHRYSIQCVLMINMWSEKIFLFIWWWFMIVACVTIINFIYWSITIGTRNRRYSYIQKLLFGFQHQGEDCVTSIQAVKFADYIGPDVVLVLHLISSNAGELMASRVCKAVYTRKRKLESNMVKTMSRPKIQTIAIPNA